MFSVMYLKQIFVEPEDRTNLRCFLTRDLQKTRSEHYAAHGFGLHSWLTIMLRFLYSKGTARTLPRTRDYCLPPCASASFCCYGWNDTLIISRVKDVRTEINTNMYQPHFSQGKTRTFFIYVFISVSWNSIIRTAYLTKPSI